MPDPQALVVPLEVKEGEPDTVVISDRLRDEVKVPDPQALVVLVNAKECEPELVEVAGGETLVKLLRVEE